MGEKKLNYSNFVYISRIEKKKGMIQSMILFSFTFSLMLLIVLVIWMETVHIKYHIDALCLSTFIISHKQMIYSMRTVYHPES